MMRARVRRTARRERWYGFAKATLLRFGGLLSPNDTGEGSIVGPVGEEEVVVRCQERRTLAFRVVGPRLSSVLS